MCYKHIISKLCYLKINIDWLVQTYQLVIEKYRIWVINISSIVLSFKIVFYKKQNKNKILFFKKDNFSIKFANAMYKKV